MTKTAQELGEDIGYAPEYLADNDPNGRSGKPLWHALMSARENAGVTAQEFAAGRTAYEVHEGDDRYVSMITEGYNDSCDARREDGEQIIPVSLATSARLGRDLESRRHAGPEASQ
jgi:hypothetical protein